MHIRRLLKSRTLLEYTIRYGGLFLCCTLITGLLCNALLARYKQEVTRNAVYSIQAAVQTLEKLEARQSEMSREIYVNARSSPQAMAAGELEAYAGIEQIGAYRSALQLNDWVVAFWQDETYFAHNGRVSSRVFQERTLSLTEESCALLEERLTQRGEAGCTLLRDRSGGGALCWLYPVPNARAENPWMVGFFLRERTVAEYLREALPASASALITSGEGEAAVRLVREGMNEAQAEGLFARLLSGKGVEKLGYTAFSCALPGDLTLHAALDVGEVFGDFQVVSRVVTAVLACSAVLMIAEILLLSRRLVRPIEDLSELVRLHSGQALPQADRRSELSIVRDMIAHSYLEQETREEHQREANAQMNVQLTRMLLSGVSGKESAVRELLLSMRPGMQKAAWAVLGLACRDEEAAQALFEALSGREDLLGQPGAHR